MKHLSLFEPLARAFQIPLPKFHASIPIRTTRTARAFSNSPISSAKSQRPKADRRVTLIRYHLSHPLTPRPLRFSRTRALRHWTIHRAWQLGQARARQHEQLELERQYNAMRAACEELRVGAGDGGRLFRQAMTKKGVYGGRDAVGEGRGGGVPLEYARSQTWGPGRVAWNAEWKR